MVSATIYRQNGMDTREKLVMIYPASPGVKALHILLSGQDNRRIGGTKPGCNQIDGSSSRYMKQRANHRSSTITPEIP